MYSSAKQTINSLANHRTQLPCFFVMWVKKTNLLRM